MIEDSGKLNRVTEPVSRDDQPMAAVLAGGRASRLGGAKATAELCGEPLISYPLAAARQAGLSPFVVAKRDSPLPPIGCELISEADQPQHPLCGIVAALRHARDRPLVVIACDMPLVSASLLEWLASCREPLVVPSAGGRLQPLQALYSPGLLPAIEAGLRELASVQRVVESLDPRIVSEQELSRFGNPEQLFLNVNTAVDLKRAAVLIERRDEGR